MNRFVRVTATLLVLGPGIACAQIDPLPTVFWFRGSPTVVVVHKEVPQGGAVVEKLGRLPEESRFAEFTFDPSHTAVDARPANNVDGLGKRAITLLAVDDRQARPVVEVRSLRGDRLRNIPFNKGHEAIALDILPDQNGNQSDEAVVLARQTAYDRARLLIRDLATKDKVNSISLPKTFDALDVITAPDLTGNGFSEALVLAARKSDGRAHVLIWDTGNSGKIVHIRLRPGRTPVDYDYYRSSSGVDQVVLHIRKLDGSAVRLHFDVLTGAKIQGFGFGFYDPVAYTREYVRTQSRGQSLVAWREATLSWDEVLDRASAGGRLQFSDGLRPVDLALIDHFAGSLRHETVALLRDPADETLYLSIREPDELLLKVSIP